MTEQAKSAKAKRDTAGGANPQNEKLAALLAKQAKITARIAEIKSREAAQARKDDNHLKILLGAAVLADSVKHHETRETMKAILGRAITKPVDVEFLTAKGWL